MFSFTKKTEPVHVGKYPAVVERIHHEFSICGETLLKQALSLINDIKINEDKIDRLREIGFKNVVEVKEGTEILDKKKMNEELARLIQYYQYRYPLNKFITKEQVDIICKKYNLVCGELSRFKGFVPDKNLREIESFNLRGEDEIVSFLVKDIQFSYPFLESEQMEETIKFIKKNNSIIEGADMQTRYNNRHYHNIDVDDVRIFLRNKFKVSTSKLTGEIKTNKGNYSICAPKKDMDLKGLIQKGFFYFTKNITTFSVAPDDPVVLQPVKGGFLILTAWGDEASDPIVVNSINN